MENGSAREEETEPPGPEQAPPSEPDDSIWDRVSNVSTIAPIHGDPTLEPADNPWELAMMAGWGDPEENGRGHDALQGVDALLLGEVDAREEIRIEGPGLDLEHGERLNDPIDGDLEYEPMNDWTSHL